MKLVILAFSIIANLGFPLVHPSSHQFEDDFVERTLAIIIRGNKAEITYSIGLNENTTEKILSKWSKLDAVTSTAVVAPPKPNGPPVQLEKDSGHALSPELTKRFQGAAGKFITENLKVKIGQKPQQLKLISAEPAPRHPFAITLKWELAIPEQKVVDLQIIDSNFLDLDGASRISLKATGNAMLLQSNAAPILIRAKRTLLAELGLKDRKDEMTVLAKIGFANR
jgi:hypothetical protein